MNNKADAIINIYYIWKEVSTTENFIIHLEHR